MNRIIQIPKKEEPVKLQKEKSAFGLKAYASPNRSRSKVLPWLVFMIFISTLIYGSSYLSLFWLPPYEGMDMKSQLTADYGPWTFMVFQPVDPAIIEEIKQERGLPGQIVIDKEPWSTPVLTAPSPLPANSAASATPQPTNDDPSSSPTALQTTHTSTPIPTSVISFPEFTVTPQPTEAVSPTQSGKPPKTPKPRNTRKPPKTPKSN